MKKIIIYAIVLLGFMSLNVFAQRTVPDTSLRWNPCNVSFTRSPIQSAPPYSLGMPPDVIYTYMAIDSLSKLAISFNGISDIVKTTLSFDTLEVLLRCLNSTINYDPLLFRDYLTLGYFLNEDYDVKPGALYSIFENAIYEKYGWNAELPYVTFADLIYEIEVVDVYEDIGGRTDSLLDSVLEDHICIQAKVLAAIKGGSAVSICNEDNIVGNCIQFTYKKGWWTSSDPNSDVETLLVDLDSIGVDEDGKIIYSETLSESNQVFASVHDVNPGDKYIIFCKIYKEYSVHNGAAEFICYPYLHHQKDGGMFKVIDDNVIDRDNFFGLGQEVPVSQFVNFVDHLLYGD